MFGAEVHVCVLVHVRVFVCVFVCVCGHYRTVWSQRIKKTSKLSRAKTKYS
jgi:hypothetical protein